MESVGEAETINQPMVPNHFSLTQSREKINQQNLNFVVFCVPMRNTEKTCTSFLAVLYRQEIKCGFLQMATPLSHMILAIYY
jgi:hypothetical protein